MVSAAQKMGFKSLDFTFLFVWKLEAMEKFQEKSYTSKCPFWRTNSDCNIVNGYKEGDWWVRHLFVAIAEVLG